MPRVYTYDGEDHSESIDVTDRQLAILKENGLLTRDYIRHKWLLEGDMTNPATHKAIADLIGET